jgi:O-antigen ligase
VGAGVEADMTVAAVGRRGRVLDRIGPFEFLTIYLVLLFGMSARFVVPGVGALGSPATLMGFFAFGWWVTATLLGQREVVGWNPVRWAVLFYLAAQIFSWIVAASRPSNAGLFPSPDMGLLMRFGLVGVALLAMDGIRTRDELNRLLDRAIICSMLMVAVGLIQFIFTYDLAPYMRLPGLRLNNDAVLQINSRSNFNRPAGTSLHAIEFGVVSAALIPPAYLFARRHRYLTILRRRVAPSSLPVLALAFAAMVSLSRSAILAAAVALIGLLIIVSWRERATIVVTAIVVVLTAGVLVNGLVGTLRSLFTSADTDPSVQARIERTPRVLELIAEHPYIGRGLGTFSIQNDFLLDNEIQKTAIETGLVGAAILIGFVVVAAIVGSRIRAGGELDRLTGKVLVVTIVALFISSYTFDSFFYRILTGVLFLFIGLIGALHRLANAVPESDRLSKRLRPGERRPSGEREVLAPQTLTLGVGTHRSNYAEPSQ